MPDRSLPLQVSPAMAAELQNAIANQRSLCALSALSGLVLFSPTLYGAMYAEDCKGPSKSFSMTSYIFLKRRSIPAAQLMTSRRRRG